MSARCSSTLAVVLGASGRLGRELLPRLADSHLINLVGIGRSACPQPALNMHWLEADLSNLIDRRHSISTLSRLAHNHSPVIIIDLLLDRSTVTAMRRSIASATDYTLMLHDHLPGHRHCLVAASTIAVLAVWPYRTPYGMAKRNQLTRYARHGPKGTAFLLPSLIGQETPTTMGTWRYQEAAEVLARRVSHLTVNGAEAFEIAAPVIDVSGSLRGSATYAVQRRIRPLLGYTIAKWTTSSDAPGTHRQVSHHLLSFTPWWLRRHVDHHLAPTCQVGRLGRALRCSVRWERP